METQRCTVANASAYDLERYGLHRLRNGEIRRQLDSVVVVELLQMLRGDGFELDGCLDNVDGIKSAEFHDVARLDLCGDVRIRRQRSAFDQDG